MSNLNKLGGASSGGHVATASPDADGPRRPVGVSPPTIQTSPPAPSDVLDGPAGPRDSAAPGAAGLTALLKSVAHQAAAHPLARHASHRAQEREVGRLAAAHPAAQQAADALAALATSFLTTVGGVGEAQLHEWLAAPLSTKTGAVLPQDVPEALARGNLREKLALVDLLAPHLGRALQTLGERAGADPSFRDHLERTTKLRVDNIIAKAALNRGRYQGRRAYDSLVLDPRSPLQSLPEQRLPRTFTRLDRESGTVVTQRVHDVKARHQTHRRGVDFDEHSGLPLSGREKRALREGFAADAAARGENAALYADFESVAHARLNLTDGAHGKRPNPRADFIAVADRAGLPTTAGISGHTYKFLSYFEDLGGERSQLPDLRLAAVAFLVPQHHSLHEVYSAAAAFAELPYDPRLDTADKLARELRREVDGGGPVRASERVALALRSEPPRDLKKR